MPPRTLPRSRPESEELAPVVRWSRWYGQKARHWKQGSHQLIVGPTQSGKTLLAHQLANLRKYVVVFGTKPVDPSLDEYVADGYERIDHWPPTRHDFRNQENGQARFILWPKIKKREELRAHRAVYAKALDEIFIEGRWTIVIDEGLWMAAPTGLGLGRHMSDLFYGAASNKVTGVLLVQRPANVPPVTWTQCSDALIFHIGRTDDVRELASMGVYDPAEARAVVRSLRGHQFLDLPCRGGAEWSITEVELGAR